MRARAMIASITSSAAVLLIGWQLGAQAIVAMTPPQSDTSTGSSAGTSSGGTESGGGAPATSTPATYTGDAVRTRFGDVQVQITVTDGSLTDVTALQLTDADRKSVQISNRAEPVLRSAVLKAQSAEVSVVSGATYTSDGYLQSLQSALDQARL